MALKALYSDWVTTSRVTSAQVVTTRKLLLETKVRPTKGQDQWWLYTTSIWGFSWGKWFWHLETSVQGPLNGDALRGVGAVRGDRRDERVQLISLLLQLLHQGLDGSLAKWFGLASLSKTGRFSFELVTRQKWIKLQRCVNWELVRLKLPAILCTVG